MNEREEVEYTNQMKYKYVDLHKWGTGYKIGAQAADQYLLLFKTIGSVVNLSGKACMFILPLHTMRTTVKLHFDTISEYGPSLSIVHLSTEITTRYWNYLIETKF